LNGLDIRNEKIVCFLGFASCKSSNSLIEKIKSLDEKYKSLVTNDKSFFKKANMLAEIMKVAEASCRILCQKFLSCLKESI
jgi:hypothetical protein